MDAYADVGTERFVMTEQDQPDERDDSGKSLEETNPPEEGDTDAIPVDDEASVEKDDD